MYELQFLACHRHSSATFSKIVFVSDSEDLNAEWESFVEEVPFTNWYSDNSVLSDEAPDSLQEAVESLE